MPSADAEAPEEPAGEAEQEIAVDEARDSLLEALTSELGDAVVASYRVPGRDLWIRVATAAWADTADYLRHRQRFRFFDWLSVVDWLPSPYGRSHDAAVDAVDEEEEPPTGPPTGADSYAGGETRFQVFARVHSLATGIGLTVKADVGNDLTIRTWTATYPGADWHEREAFEMFGINFAGHPGLRHLYLPGDFEGHPLRKDYPLMARLVKPWPGIVDVEPMPDVEDVGTSGPDEGGAG